MAPTSASSSDELPRCELITLDRVDALAFELAQKVRASGFAPDLVVAIARGGYVPARLLSDFLELHELTSLTIRHYAPGARRADAARVHHPLNADVRGQRVLVVDDVNDTGKTIAVAREHLASLGAAEVRFAVLHEKTGSSIRADYHAEVMHGWHWLVYQWALVEDATAFLARLAPPAATPADGRRRLADEIGLVIDDTLWAQVEGSLA